MLRFNSMYITAVMTLFMGNAVAESFVNTSNNNTNQYLIDVVQHTDLTKRALLGGRIISSSDVNVSAKQSGDVISFEGIEGSYYKSGDVILELEKEAINARRDAVIAEIANAREAIRNAQVQYSQAIISPNSNQMFGGAFNTFTDPVNNFFGNANPEYDRFAYRTERLTGLNQARNALTQAQAKLKLIDEELADATVVAPFDGVITKKYIEVGDNVQIGQQLLEFSNLAQLQVEVNVPSRFMQILKVGASYRVKIDNLSRVVNATLSQIYPLADRNRHSIKIKLDLPENLPILPGMYAEIELQGKSQTRQAYIPKSAVMWRLSLPSVFVVDKFNKLQLRFVRLGEDIDDRHVSVLSGVRIGQRVIINPNTYSISGDSI